MSQKLKGHTMQARKSRPFAVILVATALAAAAFFVSNLTHAGIPGLPSPTEAEVATITGGVVANANSGFTGTGYVEYAAEGSLEWTLNVPRDGIYQLQFRYALNAGSRPLTIRNGTYTFVKPNVAFASTGSFSNWGTVEVYAKLSAGNNFIRAESTGAGMPNIDHLLFSMTPPDLNKFLTYPIHSSDAVFKGSAANANAYYATIDPLSEKNDAEHVEGAQWI